MRYQQAPNIRDIEKVVPPFEVIESRPDHPDQGGLLDRGIVAHLEDGSRVLIGEIWAACPHFDDGRKVSIDTDEVSDQIVRAVNAYHASQRIIEELVAAIEAQGDGGPIDDCTCNWCERTHAALAHAKEVS